MWSAYLKEKSDIEVLEIEHGFMAYSLGTDYLCIEEMYVAPEWRKCGVASRMLRKATQRAHEAHKRFILTSVSINNKTAALSMRAQLAAGFTPIRAEGGQIWFSLEVNDG